MSSREEIDGYIKELQQTIVAASLNYDVWRAYKSKETREKFIEVMNRYTLFFQTGINAHFLALIIPLYRFYENKSDTYNICQLLKRIRSGGDLPAETVAALDEIVRRAEPLWKKVRVLRNRAFGHRSKAHAIEELFKEANIKLDDTDDLKKLLDMSKEILNKITYAWDKSTHPFDDFNASDDVIRMLKDLRRIQST